MIKKSLICLLYFKNKLFHMIFLCKIIYFVIHLKYIKNIKNLIYLNISLNDDLTIYNFSFIVVQIISKEC